MTLNNFRSGPSRSTRGFTLIEVILAMSILVLLAGLAYGALIQIIRSKKLLDDRREETTIASSVISRLTRELQLATDTGSPLMPPCNSSTKPPPGREIYLKGEQQKLPYGERGDSIRFLALNGAQYFPDGASRTGIVQIEYRVTQDPDNQERFVLVRVETPLIRPFTKACERSIIFPITDRIRALEFSYYNEEKEAWRSDWGIALTDKLPSLIQFTLKLKSPMNSVHSYVSAVAVRPPE